MPELPSRAKVEVSFQELLENYDGHDIGLGVFDGRISQLTDNANDDGGSFSEIIEPGVESLNEEWLYHDDIAKVTGRLYVVDGSMKDELTNLWGAPDKDDQGNLSYFVEDQELCSYGITEGPHGARIDDSRIAAKIGYGFALPGADAPFAQVILYPGESSKHVYPLPTPEAIDLKLHKSWPEKMKMIDSLLGNDDVDIEKLPLRLAAIARQMQSELGDSSETREWLSVYINEKLSLNKIWPYVITVKDTLHFLDDPASLDWLEMSIDGTVRLDVRKPRIEFIRADSNGAIRAMLFADMPDTRDEWEGTPIGVNMSDILHIRGTRAHRSIVDYALEGYEQNIDAALKAADIDDGPDSPEIPRVTIKPPEREHHSGDPTNVKEMKMLQNEIKAVIDMVAPIAEKTYDTFEQASEVSSSLARTIGNMLIGAGIYNYALKFEGEYALRAVTLKDGGRMPEPGEVIIRADAENPFAKLMHGDNFSGTFFAFHGDVISNEDEESETVYYQVVPRMIVDVRTDSATALNYGAIPMVEVLVQQRGMVSLDGSVNITIPSLTRYEADKKARVEVANRLGGNHDMTKRVNRVFTAFNRETDSGYQDLKHVNDIRKMAQYIEAGGEDGTSVFEALSSMLLNRSMMASGSLLRESGDDMFFVDGIVADVSMRIPESDEPGPYIAIFDKEQNEPRYMRLSTVESLAF